MAKTLDVIANRASDERTLVQPGEIADARFRDLRNPPSLQALKLHAFMVKSAGGAVAEDRWHQVTLAEIREVPGLKNHDRRSLIDLVAQIRGVVIEFEDDTFTNIVGLLDVAKVQFEDGDGPAVMRWKFGEGFRELVALSDYYAIIDRQTMFAMTSRYSMQLFQMLAIREKLKHKHRETFSVEDLRARLGVPEGKLSRWDMFNRKALTPAVAEVNQLARFAVTATPKKRGRNVVAVELAWEPKPDLTETKAELAGHSAGRRARREGSVEQVEPAPAVIARNAFPPEGRISYSRWADLVRDNVPGITPDVDLVADAFRTWAASKGIPLHSEGIERTFIGFCRQFQA